MPIAILFGLVVMAILLPTLMTATQQNSTIILGTVASQQLKQLTSAAQQYIQANFSAVLGASSTTTPATITVPMLIATGFLPQGFQALNPYGQTWQVEALQAPAGQIQALVMSTGGTPVPTRDAARITAQAGAEGGIVGGGTGNLASPTCAAGQACGAFGGWKVATNGYTGLGPGSLLGLLAFNSAGQLNQQYLYRVAVPGQPQLNAMQTDLSMTDQGGTPHNITGARNVQAQTAQLAGGWVNGQPGALQIGSNYYYGDASNAAVRTPGGFYIQNQNGSGAADISEVSHIYASNSILPGAVANQGWGCGPWGAIAANANGSGQLMSCVNGIWTNAGGNSGPDFTNPQSFWFGAGNGGPTNGWIGVYKLCLWNGQSYDTGQGSWDVRQVYPAYGVGGGYFVWEYNGSSGGGGLGVTCYS